MEDHRPLITSPEPDWEWRAQQAADSLCHPAGKQKSSSQDIMLLISMLIAGVMTAVIYRYVEHIGFVAHLSSATRGYVLNGTAGVSFITLLAVFSTRLFRTLIGMALAGGGLFLLWRLVVA